MGNHCAPLVRPTIISMVVMWFTPTPSPEQELGFSIGGRADTPKIPQFSKMFCRGAFVAAKIPLFGPLTANIRGIKVAYAPLNAMGGGAVAPIELRLNPPP